MEKYHGDIRKLRKTARHRPDEERQLLTKCNGMGNVGVDIFFREIQMSWGELFPFADQRALKTAKKIEAWEFSQSTGRTYYAERISYLNRSLNTGRKR